MKGLSLRSLRKKINAVGRSSAKSGSNPLKNKIDAILFKDVNKYYPGKPRIKPSDMGSPCFRKIFYSYLRTPPSNKLTAKNKRIFDMGDAIHEMVRDWLKKTGYYVEYRDPKTGDIPLDRFTGKPNPEFPIVYPPLEIKKGKLDGILRINDELWVLEIKGEKTEKFKTLKSPREAHVIQTDVYVHIFELLLKEGEYRHIEELEGLTEVQGAIFLYVDKNTQDIKEYVVHKSGKALKDLRTKYKKLKTFVEEKKLPPPVEDYCFFCSYAKHCEKNYNPLKDK